MASFKKILFLTLTAYFCLFSCKKEKTPPIEEVPPNIDEVLSKFEGTHSAIAMHSCWPEIHVNYPCDTAYQAIVDIIRQDEKIIITSPTAVLDEVAFYGGFSQSEHNTMFYRSDEIPSGSIESYIRLCYEVDSFHLYRSYGGQGGGSIWLINGKIN